MSRADVFGLAAEAEVVVLAPTRLAAARQIDCVAR